MPSLTQRYLAGEWESVWNEVRALGPVHPHLSSDVDGVAEATMRRVRTHADRLAEAYVDAGLVVDGIAVRTPPTETDRADLARLIGQIGGVPAALRFCLSEVGGLWLAGDCATLGLYYHQPAPEPAEWIYPDPLVLSDVGYLADAWNEFNEFKEDAERDDDEQFWFDFAPDEVHKANVSGAAYSIPLPDSVADPLLDGVGQLKQEVTLIEYLRLSITWGGCTGWSLAPNRMPQALQRLRVRPDF